MLPAPARLKPMEQLQQDYRRLTAQQRRWERLGLRLWQLLLVLLVLAINNLVLAAGLGWDGHQGWALGLVALSCACAGAGGACLAAEWLITQSLRRVQRRQRAALNLLRLHGLLPWPPRPLS